MKFPASCRAGLLAAFLTFAAHAPALIAQTLPLGSVSTATPAEAMPDPADLVPWPVKGYPAFASDSVVNTGKWLFDAPAGKHGFVQAGPDGSLAFEDKTPAHFWGTTLVYAMTFPDKPEEIARLADSIAASGYNLVRFHHNDVLWGGTTYLQTKPPSNYALDPVYMDRLDKLASELFKRGIYVYVDLVDSRSVLEETGLDDWQELQKLQTGWKGLFPHPKIVEAWKKAATTLLAHKNPYTGRTWGQEPGVATVEIINENGPFWDWNFKLDEPMRRWHQTQWNAWLLKKYGSRARLDAQWTDVEGKKGLFDNEDPAAGTVFMPPLGSYLEWDRPYRSKTRGAARLNDYYMFLADQATTFYKDATAHIRGLGFKGIVVGSHELQGAADQYSQVQGTGTIAAHLYANGGTAWNARPTTKGVVLDGVDVKTNNWFSNIPRIKVQGAPGINGEWTGGTLTRRADVNLAVAAVMAFQGVDESLHFSFAHRSRGEAPKNFDTSYAYAGWRGGIGFTFTSLHDEPWMAVNRICAPLFTRGDLARPKTKIHLAFSTEDRLEQNLHALGISGGSGTIGGAATFLPLLHGVECSYFDTAYTGDADVAWMTGRTATGDYSRAKHAVLIGDNPYNDHFHKKRDIGVPARYVNPKAKISTLEKPVVFTVTWPYAAPRTLSFDRLEGAVELASVPPGAQPIGRSADRKYTLGWLDDRFLVLPNGRAYGTRVQDVQWLYRLYLAAARRWKIDTADNAAGAPFYRSDTRELTVDWGSGTLQIDTPKTQGFSGFMGWRENVARNLAAKIDVPYGNVLLTATDNQPIAASHRLLLVATGRMQNTGQVLGKNKNGFAAYTEIGKGPALVEALRGEVSIASSLAPSLTVYALDSAGRRFGRVPVAVRNGRLNFALSPKWGTIWFEIAAPEVAGPDVPPAPAVLPVAAATVAGPVAGGAPAASPAGEALAAWPLEEKPRLASPQAPASMPALAFLEAANARATSAAPAPAALAGGAAPSANADKTVRFVVHDFSADKFIGVYGNIKANLAQDPEKGAVARGQFGKVNKDWFGGLWLKLTTPSGVKPADGLGFGFAFKGDGTAPKDAFMDLKTASGAVYRSKSLRSIFENDAWQDVFLAPTDFTLEKGWAAKHPEEAKNLPPTPDWGSINRLDFGCGGPLMDQMSVGQFGEFYVRLANVPENKPQAAAALHAQLPPLQTPASASITLPFVPDAAITADGVADEAAWKKAYALEMNEDKVPDWHFFGSHIVDGKRLNGEGANFWMLATSGGLALLAEIHKGTPDIVTEKADWYGGDALEVFSDATGQGGKTTKQLFLAYSRPALDRAAASDPGIRIGRTRLEDGYLLESLIPWKSLGLEGVPTAPFGLEFQVDFGSPGQGRTLQMVYATGTNEAWVKSDRFLKVTIGPLQR